MSRAAKWTAAWVGAAGLGIANGVARDLMYKNRVGDLAAHQISTGTLIAALAGYSRALERRWPIPTTRSAWTIGGIWMSLTVIFEFVFGHYVAGESWRSLVRNYDTRKGRIWGVVPISMAILPAVVRALHAKRCEGETHMLEDEFLPTYDVSDAVAAVVDADATTTWAALMEVDLIELGRHRPLVGVLGALRLLPEIIGHLLHGEPPPAAPKRMHLRDTVAIPASKGGWSLLGEIPDQEIALGLVGKFWRPVIEYAAVAAEDFRDFAEPGWAKTVYALSVRPLEDRQGTLLSGVMRTATTDEHARRWFRRYWTFGVGSGAHLLVTGLLDAAREDAEHKGTA